MGFRQDANGENENLSGERISERLAALKRFTSTPDSGVTRLPFTDEARDAAEYLKKLFGSAGLTVAEDPAGAVHGIYPEAVPAPAESRHNKSIILMSHYDSVKNGGAFDGTAGIVCALEAVSALAKEKRPLPFSVEIIATNDEEGVRFGGGYFTMKALTGELAASDLAYLKDEKGITAGEAMKVYGLDPDRIGSWNLQPDSVEAVFEIHIEQGPVLDATNTDIGIVDEITGIRRFLITFSGRADHAGTTPMDMRKDAMTAFAGAVLAIHSAAENYSGKATATVGKMQCFPNQVNTVAGKVVFTVDIRSPDPYILDLLTNEIFTAVSQKAAKYSVSWTQENILDEKPVILDEKLNKRIESGCKDLNLSFRHMYSGAGHDSLIAAKYFPSAMIFIPSISGRSHCPEEHTDAKDLLNASCLMKHILLNMSETYE